MMKAHAGVEDVFYQVFEKGMRGEGECRDIDFKSSVIIMTSNAGYELIGKLFADPETAPDAGALGEALCPQRLNGSKPPFLARVTSGPSLPPPATLIRQRVEPHSRRIRRRGWSSCPR